MPKQITANDRKWYIIDASWETLWKLASKIAVILKWKNKASFAPHVDNWDYVIVIHSDKFKVTGNKLSDKMYFSHTWYLGWWKQISLNDLLKTKPNQALEFAISWMLPKNKLRRHMISRLKLFSGAEHTYLAQKPEFIQL